ncbi:MAG: hypothetical protein HYY20_04175 [Candidatus Tectomicrobia bacterium]|uniref:Uncharacterized protein n=1 Tax=Tectimicrobiota bacterium TaxID=2528274 RepID=A0A932FW84_UNCTE|nr:hypothetical protein [Candidatus Tectomicrobia bacterium]
MYTPFWVDYALAYGELSNLQYLVGVGSFVLVFILSTLMVVFLPMRPDQLKSFFQRAGRRPSTQQPKWNQDILPGHSR